MWKQILCPFLHFPGVSPSLLKDCWHWEHLLGLLLPRWVWFCAWHLQVLDVRFLTNIKDWKSSPGNLGSDFWLEDNLHLASEGSQKDLTENWCQVECLFVGKSHCYSLQCGYFKFKDQCLISHLKLSLQGITITVYRREIKLICLRWRSLLDLVINNTKILNSVKYWKVYYFTKNMKI